MDTIIKTFKIKKCLVRHVEANPYFSRIVIIILIFLIFSPKKAKNPRGEHSEWKIKVLTITEQFQTNNLSFFGKFPPPPEPLPPPLSPLLGKFLKFRKYLIFHTSPLGKFCVVILINYILDLYIILGISYFYVRYHFVQPSKGAFQKS